MNRLCKTYGIIINLDYVHFSEKECHQMWNKICRAMQLHGFHIDKRMFVIRTEKDMQSISRLAKDAIDSLDTGNRFGTRSPYHYIVDFFAIDISSYNDLRFPAPDQGIELEETYIDESISYA